MFFNTILLFLTKHQGQVKGFVLRWDCSPNFKAICCHFHKKSSSELELPHHEEDLHGIRSFHEHLASGDLTTADRGKFGWVGSYDLIIQLPNLFGSHLRQTCWGSRLKK